MFGHGMTGPMLSGCTAVSVILSMRTPA